MAERSDRRMPSWVLRSRWAQTACSNEGEEEEPEPEPSRGVERDDFWDIRLDDIVITELPSIESRLILQLFFYISE